MSEDATTPEPAAQPSTIDPVVKAGRAAAIAQKLSSRASAGAAEAESPAALPSHTEPAEAAEPAAPADEPASPQKSRAELVREKLAERAQARQQREATASENKEILQLRAELERHRGQTGVAEWLDKLRRDPVVALREAKADPRQVLELLTKDAIAPGSVRQGAEIGADAKQAMERAERVEQQFQQYIQSQAIAAERAAFAEHVADETKYPHLAKLPTQLRVLKGVRKWEELSAQGHEYDRDLIADAIEADYEEEGRFLHAAPAAKASSATAVETKQAAPKKTAKTITADMAASAGAPRQRTPDERKSNIVEKLRQRAEKQDRA